MTRTAVPTSERARPPAPRAYVTASRVLAAGAAATSILVALTWALAPSLFQRFEPDAPAMVPRSALAILLFACGLGASTITGARLRAARAASRALGVIVAALGAVTLAEYVGGELGIERAIFGATCDTLQLCLKPSLNAGLAFVLLGAALVTLDARVARARPAEILAAAALASALVALVAFAYGATPYFQVPGVVAKSSLALSTAVALGALGVGTLCARPDVGLMALVTARTPGGTVARRWLASLVAAPLAGVAVSAGHRAGMYGEYTAEALLTAVWIVAASALVFVTARSLDRADAARSRAMDELRTWRDVFYDASWGAIIGEPDGTIRNVNPAFARMHGYEPHELEGAPGTIVFPPQRRAEVPALFARIGELGHLRFEIENRRKDGSTFPVLIDATAVRDADGRVRHRVAYVQDVTESKAAEVAAARLASIVDSTGDAIISTDVDGRVESWNAAAERMYGFTAREIVGRPMFDLVPPEQLDEARAFFARLQREGTVTAYETVRMRKDGTRFDTSLTVSPVRDAAGRLVGRSTIARDITAQKRAEEALRTAHARETAHRRRLELVGNASVAVSDALTDMPRSGLGVVLATIVDQAKLLAGADVARFVDAAAPPVVLEGHALRLAIRFGDRALGELVVAKRDGAISDEDARALALLADRAGAAIHTARLYEREAAERGRLQAIIDQLPEAVIVLDAAGRVEAQNRASTALAHDVGAEDALGNRLLLDVFRPSGERLPSEELPVVRVVREGSPPTPMELVVRTSDERRVPVLASAAPIVGPLGERLGAIATFQDISAVKDLDRLREEWASIVAHDLRQPLAAIAMSVQHAASLARAAERLDPSLVRTLERTRATTARMDRMIGDLSDASRIEARRMQLAPQRVDLDALVAALIERDLAPTAGDRRIVVTRRGAPRSVEVDAGRIEQVVSNLVSNALKYGEPGADVRVGLAWSDDAVELTVTNRGAGIPAERVANVFTRFDRLHHEGQSRVPGLGLGLYICRGIVEAHGGSIWVESDPGAETTFHVRLAAPRAPVPRASADGGGGRRVGVRV